MCEFCTKHGEGKKWYLQMKNYSEELLHQELSPAQKEIVEADTRTEYLLHFFESNVLPAITGVSQVPEEAEPAPEPSESAQPEVSEEEVLRQWKVEHFSQVLPIEDVEQVLEIADSITRMACACRFITTGKTNQRYCMGLGFDRWGVLGKFPDAASSLEVLEKDEAQDALRQYDEEGLVHTVWAGVTPYVSTICNCDRDCRPYRRYQEKGRAPLFYRAEYICQVDWDLCTGCKACMSQCQFGAQFYSSALEKVYIDPARCFGCGVCRAVCPHEAITLMPRQEHPEAAGIWLRPPPDEGFCP
jgi:ferredoxin